ncbi:hypothetical protein ABGV42_01900 [Paenibacillus pabuli]|uniref:hypothetical protein n=1 Tax=Paenibacillus pabuli TaxID=1472 RepID=UPI003242EF0D
MIRVIVVGGNTDGKLAESISRNGDIKVVKSFPYIHDFHRYLTETYEGLVDFDKVVVLQHAFTNDRADSIDAIQRTQEALVLEVAVSPVLYFVLTDEEIYLHYDEHMDDIQYDKTSMLLFRKIGVKDIYSTLIGSFDTQGIYHPNFPNINIDQKTQQLRSEVEQDEQDAADAKNKVIEPVVPLIQEPQAATEVVFRESGEDEPEPVGLDYPVKKGAGLSSIFKRNKVPKNKPKTDAYNFGSEDDNENKSENNIDHVGDITEVIENTPPQTEIESVHAVPVEPLNTPPVIPVVPTQAVLEIQHDAVIETTAPVVTETVETITEGSSAVQVETVPVETKAERPKRGRQKPAPEPEEIPEPAETGGLDLTSGGGGLGSKLLNGVLGRIKQKVNANPELLPDGAEYHTNATPKRRKTDNVSNAPIVYQGAGLRKGTLLITGDRRSGVTSSAANIAHALSGQGTVVVVDLDFKRAGMTRYFAEHLENPVDIRNTYSTYAALNNPSIFSEVGFVINENLLLLTLTEPTSFVMDPEFPWTEKIGGKTRKELREPRHISSLLSFLRGAVDYVVVDVPMELVQEYPDIILQADTSILCVNNSEESIHNTLLVALSDIYESNTNTFNAVVSRFNILLTNYNNLCKIKGKETTPEYVQNFLQSQGGVWAKTRCVGYIPHLDDFVKQTQNGELIVQKEFANHFYDLIGRM